MSFSRLAAALLVRRSRSSTAGWCARRAGRAVASRRCRARAPRSRTAAASRSAAIASRPRTSSSRCSVLTTQIGELDGPASACRHSRLLCAPVRVHVVDPPAYTPPYDHALCGGAGRARAPTSTLVTSALRLRRGARAPTATRSTSASTAAGRRAGRRAAPAARARAPRPRHAALPPRAPRDADVVHFQWLAVAAARRAPAAARAPARPHRPRRPAARAAPRPASPRSARLYERVDAVVVHSEHGRAPARRRGRASTRRRVDGHPARRVRPPARTCRAPAAAGRARRASSGPVVLLLRPACARTRASTCSLRGLAGDRRTPSCGSSGMPRMDIDGAAGGRAAGRALRRALRRRRGGRPALFRRADLVVLPYREIDQSGVLVHRARASAGRCCSATSAASRRSPRPAPRELVPPGDPGALHGALAACSATPRRRRALAAARARRGRGAYSLGRRSPSAHLALYERLGVGRGVMRAEGRLLGLRRAARLHAGRLPAAARGARPGAAPAAPRAEPAAAARRCRASRSSSPRTDEAAVIEAKVAQRARARLPARPPRGRSSPATARPTTPPRAPAPPAPTSCSTSRAAARSARRTPAVDAAPTARACWSRSPTPTRSGSADALRALVAAFADPRGRLRLRAGALRQRRTGTNQEGLYWRYEMWLRALESRLARVTGGNGAIYAVRPRGLHARRPGHGPRPLASRSTSSSAAAAPSTRPRRARRRRWSRRSRASSRASGA